MRLHTARLRHLTSTVQNALAKSQRTALPEVIEILQSVHHQLSGCFNCMFIYNKRHYLQPYTVPKCCGHTQYRTVVDIHCAELLWTYAVPNCCAHTLYRNAVDIVPKCCEHILCRIVVDIHCTEMLQTYTVPNC